MNQIYPFVSEFMATLFLLLLGNSIGMTIKLNKNFSGKSQFIIPFAWGLAVMFSSYIGYATDSHMNPAISLSKFLSGDLSGYDFCIYVVAQFCGAFTGSVLAYIIHYKLFEHTKSQELKLTAFTTALYDKTTETNFISQVIISFVFIFPLLVLGNMPLTIPDKAFPILLGSLVALIGFVSGSKEGYPVNPARDLAPRLAHFILPIKGKGSSHWKHAWIPLFAPFAGTIIAVFVFRLFFF